MFLDIPDLICVIIWFNPDLDRQIMHTRVPVFDISGMRDTFSLCPTLTEQLYTPNFNPTGVRTHDF